MKTLLLINDDSPEAIRAGELALAIAQKVQANIILVNTCVINKKVSEKIAAGYIAPGEGDELGVSGIRHHLDQLNVKQINFTPAIDEFDAAGMDETEVAEIVNKKHIWMMVKGMADNPSIAPGTTLNIHNILNKVLCPLLLIPAYWQAKNIERMVYLADLRYCRLEIVKYLGNLAKAWNAALSIAHTSANGLPDMDEHYALAVFSEEISRNVNYDQLFFNNIKEKDIAKIVDVMINGMHNDILVMVNHRFHFEEILGMHIGDTLPGHITIPLLIFPY